MKAEDMNRIYKKLGIDREARPGDIIRNEDVFVILETLLKKFDEFENSQRLRSE